jgi:hypothetical protein
MDAPAFSAMEPMHNSAWSVRHLVKSWLVTHSLRVGTGAASSALVLLGVLAWRTLVRRVVVPLTPSMHAHLLRYTLSAHTSLNCTQVGVTESIEFERWCVVRTPRFTALARYTAAETGPRESTWNAGAWKPAETCAVVLFVHKHATDRVKTFFDALRRQLFTVSIMSSMPGFADMNKFLLWKSGDTVGFVYGGSVWMLQDRVYRAEWGDAVITACVVSTRMPDVSADRSPYYVQVLLQLDIAHAAPRVDHALFMQQLRDTAEREAARLKPVEASEFPLLKCFAGATTGVWSQTATCIQARPLTSIAMPAALLADVLHDIRTFLAKRAWYTNACVPFRRCVLLHGPPGTGKTSLIHAIATELDKPLCTLRVDAGMTDATLQTLCATAPGMVVIEEVDRIIPQNHVPSAAVPASAPAPAPASAPVLSLDAAPGAPAQVPVPPHSVSMGGLLKALECHGARPGVPCLIFMTTNHIDRLDAALLRCGRVDRTFEISYAQEPEFALMYLRFFPGDAARAAAFAKALAQEMHDLPVTLASVQEYFIRCEDDADRAVANVAQVRAIQQQMRV